MKKTLIREALKIAQFELDSHPEFSHYLHWTFIVKDNQLLEWGTNKAGAVPAFLGYNPNTAKQHSEFVAYRRAKGLLKGEPFGIINVRLSRQGEMKNSQPCEICHNWLSLVGCNRVVFSTPLGWAKL